jgi:hypothetical protein
MKTHLKTSIIITLLCLTGYSYSQEVRFIELTVSDTITLHPTHFIYRINLGQQSEFMGLILPKETKQEGSSTVPSINEISNILDKEKCTYTINHYSDYSISNSTDQPSIDVTLNSENELKSLFNLLKTKEGISGRIEEISYEPMSKYYKEIYTRLYTKAINQTTLLANITGNTIGILISASNVEKENDSYMDVYEQMTKNMPKGIFGEIQVSAKKEEVKMVFKFEIK